MVQVHLHNNVPNVHISIRVPHSLLLRVTFLLLTTGLGLTALAGDIYRWKDEQGRTHMGDTVPAQYKANAVKSSSKAFDLPQQQVIDAGTARAKQISDAEKIRTSQNNPQPRDGNQPSAPVNAASTDSPRVGETTCQEQQRAYAESTSCFENFKNSNGSTKAEGFLKCRDLKEPINCR